MKAAPLMDAIRRRGRMQARLVHTGQHFDANMSDVFFKQLGMAEPKVYLDIHGGPVTDQVGRMILELAKEFSANSPDTVVVFGDVNSTLAAAVTANKLGIRLAHVEAGLRSFDRSMPEEHNRIVTDMLADLLFTPSPDADANLQREGVANERIFRVGNIMVDSLLRFKPVAEGMRHLETLGLEAGAYGLVTLHRPSNVDDAQTLRQIVDALIEIQEDTPVLFPIHPRTREKMEAGGLGKRLDAAGVKLAEPTGYLEFLSLMTQAKFVLTDSGGIQEETTVLGIPCLTARENTERPITLEYGNRLVGNSTEGILAGYRKMLTERVKPGQPEMWDGKTAERIEEVLFTDLNR
jgi:UDP-N-acetylglucosamine 2-epimerase (non-hydrolysing)